ncbi:MAG TPA: hypothetical protein VGL22_10525 [Terracidiphilus sp.]|jgi:hypothetical protein
MKNDRKDRNPKTPETERVPTSVPAVVLEENKASQVHSKSHAAHLEDTKLEPHSKPSGDLRFLAPFPTGRKQP